MLDSPGSSGRVENQIANYPRRPRSATSAKGVSRGSIPRSKCEDVKGGMIAFDDNELSDWLAEGTADESENFLCALAEAAVSAEGQDFAVIRPALIQLKRKYDARRTVRG